MPQVARGMHDRSIAVRCEGCGRRSNRVVSEECGGFGECPACGGRMMRAENPKEARKRAAARREVSGTEGSE